MSHIVTTTTAVRDREVLKKTCERRGMQAPKYVEGMFVGGVRANGHKVQLPGWRKEVLFNTESGEKHFDNWSAYGESHPDVIAGRKRVGDDGRWGDLVELDRFEDEYALTALQVEAEAQGHVFEYQQNEDQIDFQIHIPG